MSISSEKMIERKEIMDGNILHVTVDTVRINGTDRTSTREVVWHKGACAIMPVTEDGKIILVRQYRYAAGTVMLEIPAGKIDRDGESPDCCAARELEEEAGVTGELIYLARNLKKGMQHLDEDEFMNIEYYTPQEVEAMIDADEIIDAKTIACFQKARKYLPGL